MPTPPDTQVISAIQDKIPNYFKVQSVEMEAVADVNHPGVTDIKVKAMVEPKQNLFSPATSDELKPVQDLKDSAKTFEEWLDKEGHSNSASLLGAEPDRISDQPFAHLSQKSGDQVTLYCNVTAEHQVDRWKVTVLPDSFDWPEKPGIPTDPATLGINSPEGDSALAKMKAQVDSMRQYRLDTQEKIDKANRAFSDTVAPWLTSGKSFSGTYEDKVLGGTRVERIVVSFSHFSPNTGHFEGTATFLTVHNGVMAFAGDVQDSSLYLHDMKILADPEELTPDDYWVLHLDEKGNLAGSYAGGNILIAINAR